MTCPRCAERDANPAYVVDASSGEVRLLESGDADLIRALGETLEIVSNGCHALDLYREWKTRQA